MSQRRGEQVDGVREVVAKSEMDERGREVVDRFVEEYSKRYGRERRRLSRG